MLPCDTASCEKKTTTSKTENRLISESSVRNLASYACMVASTHCIPSETADKKTRKQLTEESTKGARQMFRLVSDVIGRDVPLRLVKPCYILSTDDVATYWVPSVASRDPSLTLVYTESLVEAGKRSNYACEEKMDGIRVKFTHTFAMSGLSAAIFISVAGLKERELPVDTCPGGVMVLKIPGPTVGGKDVQSESQD